MTSGPAGSLQVALAVMVVKFLILVKSYTI